MVSKINHKSKSSVTVKKVDPIQAAIDYGIDISMLKDNLKRSPAEHIRRHQIALETSRILSKAKCV